MLFNLCTQTSGAGSIVSEPPKPSHTFSVLPGLKSRNLERLETLSNNEPSELQEWLSFSEDNVKLHGDYRAKDSGGR